MDYVTQLLNLLITPPGNVFYHLVLAFSVLGALPAAYSQWRSTEFPQAQRTVVGLVILLAAQLALFASSLLAWQGIVSPALILPPVDRAVLLFSLVWVIWLWAFPEPARSADAASVLLSLLTGAALAYSLVSRLQQDPNLPYNATVEGLGWSILSLVVVALGALILLLRRPSGWGSGLAFLAFMLTGHLLDLFFPLAQANFPGFVRVASLAVYPLLFTLPQRFPSPGDHAAQLKKNKPGSEERPFRERRRYSTDAKTLLALLALASETDPAKISHGITRAIAQAMLADLCFLIIMGDDRRSLHIASGYDLIREESLDGGVVDKDSVPLLATAIQRGKPLRLPASSTSSDLKGLGDMLGLSGPGHLLNVPVTVDKGPMGGILLLSPYSNRLWTADDQTFLTNVAATFIPIIERGQHITQIELARQKAEQVAQEARVRTGELERSHNELSAQVSALKARAPLAPDEVPAQLEELRARIAQLQKDNDELRSRSTGTVDSSHLESELRLTLKELAKLQNALAAANIKILELEKRRPTGAISSEQAEVIASISQELRQPMSSIIGYADLLLGESVGILGALQRKFIERIKSSTERIDSLVNDLIQISTLDTGIMSLKPEPIDLNLIIDNAMAYTSSQLREKTISLRIDLPQMLKPIHADREALQQILIHLLQNAGAATPVEGTVTLRVRIQSEAEHEYVLIQVADSGGGIPAEDLQRVFSRLYRADNVLIQGVGDTGVGLSIAKTLTEAQHGRIWVDTEIGSGSTFSVLLPIMHSNAEAHKEG